MLSFVGLRERKKQETRNSIIKAAVQLFSEQGYEATTIDDIVARANYSRSTFFRLFGTKEDVVFGDLSELMMGVIEELRSLGPGADAWTSVRRAFTVHVLENVPVDSTFAPETVALWFSVPALQRRYAEVALESERLLAGYFAESWGTDPDRWVEANVVAAATLSVARSSIQARLSDNHHSVADCLNTASISSSPDSPGCGQLQRRSRPTYDRRTKELLHRSTFAAHTDEAVGAAIHYLGCFREKTQTQVPVALTSNKQSATGITAMRVTLVSDKYFVSIDIQCHTRQDRLKSAIARALGRKQSLL